VRALRFGTLAWKKGAVVLRLPMQSAQDLFISASPLGVDAYLGRGVVTGLAESGAWSGHGGANRGAR
jgi:hypothetical protein